MYGPDAYYCYSCRRISDAGDLRRIDELMDPSVPGSWQHYYVCPECGSDDMGDVTLDEVDGLLKNALELLGRPDAATQGMVGTVTAIVEDVKAILEQIN